MIEASGMELVSDKVLSMVLRAPENCACISFAANDMNTNRAIRIMRIEWICDSGLKKGKITAKQGRIYRKTLERLSLLLRGKEL